ncbi:hypothetical protein Tco_0855766 [Tanacetum coccineum]
MPYDSVLAGCDTSKSVSKDPFPKSSEFNAEHYATFVAYQTPFHKYPKPFLCLVELSRHYTLDENTYPEFLHDNDEEMDLLTFIRTADPTKVRVGERQRAEGEPRLLDTTVGRVVPLLPVAPARESSELETSVDKLFDEGGSGDQVEQGDFASGGQGVGIHFVSEAVETTVEDVAPLQPRRQKKQNTMVVDAGEPSHPAKKLRGDHSTPGGPSVAGKSRSAVQRLLAGALLNPKVGIAALPTLPFVTSFVFATLEHEDSSHHLGVNVAEAEVDSVVRSFVPMITAATTVTSIVDPATTVKEKFVESSLFGGGSSSAGGADHIIGGFFDLTGNDFIVSGICTVISPNTDLQKVMIRLPLLNNTIVLESSLFGGGSSSAGGTDHTIGGFSDLIGNDFIVSGIRTVIIPNMDLQKFFVSIRGMEHDQLFTEFNVRAARQMSLGAVVRMCDEYNIKKKRRLKSTVDEQAELLKVREVEIENLKAQLLLKEGEAAEAIRLRAKASKFEAIEKSLQDEVKTLKDHNVTLEKEKNDLGVKVADLAASVKVREQEVADLDALVTSVKFQKDNLVDQVRAFTLGFLLSSPSSSFCFFLSVYCPMRSTKVDESKLCDIPVCIVVPQVFSKGLIGGARVAFKDEFGAAKEREVSCEAQQGRSGVKRKFFGSFRNNMGNDPILALPEGSNNFVVMRRARVRMLA